MPSKISKKLKQAIEERANGCCEYCKAQQRYSHDYFSVEHIIPLIKKGTSNEDNLAFCCQACNNHKYIFTEAIDPITGMTAVLFNPRKQDWKLHFTWDKSFTLIIGLSSSGRATIERLSLNREGLVNLRQVLFEVNKHPPANSL